MVVTRGFSRVLFFLFLYMFTGATTIAQSNNPLLEKLQLKLAKPDLKERASYAGQERALLCGYCHGQDGNSVKPDVPNLAGQNPAYLLEQISSFASGKRKDYVMNSLASKFTEDDRVNLAIFYSAKKVKKESYDSGKATLGKRLYLQRCQSCHGKGGMGNTGYARLAGQKQTYIQNTLVRFRENMRSASKNKKRRSPIMEPIASQLSEQDIQNLAAYVASL